MYKLLTLFVWIFVLLPYFAGDKDLTRVYKESFLKGQWEEALKETEDPRLQALAYWRLGKVEALTELVEHNKDNLKDYQIRLTLLKEGTLKALEIGLALLREDPKNPHLLVEAFAAAVLAGDEKKVRNLFSQLPAGETLDVTSLETLCYFQLKAGWILKDPAVTRKAIIQLTDLGIQKFNWNPRFKTLKALYYFRVGQRIDAKEWCEELKSEDAQDPLFFLIPKEGNLSFSSKKILLGNIGFLHEEARKRLIGRETLAGIKDRGSIKPYLNQLNLKAPRHPITLALNGARKFLLNNEKVKEPEELKQTVTRSGLYWSLLSHIVSEPFDRRKALDFGRNACRAEPWNVDFLVDHAINCHREGLTEESLRSFSKAHQLEPRLTHVRNLKTLLNSVVKDFVVFKDEIYHIRMRRDEWPAFKNLFLSAVKKNFAELKKRYQTEPDELHFQLFSDKQDFDVSVFMVPTAPAIGACMGRLITMPAPSYLQFHKEPWAAVLRHEMAHAFHVEKSRGKVSRWFTEGLAHYEEVIVNPAWDWEEGFDQKLLNLKANGELKKIGQLNEGFEGEDVRFYYQYCRWVLEWIDQKKGWSKVLEFLDAYGDGIGDEEIFDKVLDLNNLEAEEEFQLWLQDEVIQKIPLYAEIEGSLFEPSGLAFSLSHGQVVEIIEATENSKRPICQLYRALAYEELGESDLAYKEYQELKDDLDGVFLFHFYFGRNLVESGYFTQAIDHLKKAVHLYPRYVEHGNNPYYWLYQAYRESGKHSLAVEAVWEFTRVQQKDHRSRFWLVRRFLEVHDYGRVRILLKEIEQIHPYHFEAILWQADQAQREGNRELEKLCYERLFACAPIEDLVDQETFWSDNERLGFLSQAIDPWLKLVAGNTRREVALIIEKYFPQHPSIKDILTTP